MDFKSLISQLDQLSEATDRSEPGKVKHTAEPGGYGRKDDEDEDGNKIKDKSVEKKGKGRPKKATSTSGEDKKYDFSAFGVKTGKDVKLPKHDKKKTVKHSLKEYFDQLDTALNEADQIQIKPASQLPKKPGQTSQPGQPQQVAGQPAQNTQVIQQGDKTLGTVNNPQLANQIKQSIGKGEMTLTPDGQMDEDFGAVSGALTGAALGTALGAVKGRYGDMKQREQGHTAYTPDDQKDKERTAMQRLRAAAGFPSKNDPNVKIDEKDIGKHNNATTGFDALVRKLTPKYGKEAATKIAGEQMKKIKEAEMPTHDGDMGAGLGAGRSQQFEAKKPDANKNGIPDYVEDGKGKNDLKKKKVKEGMNTRLKAARHAGKSHALGKQGYNCSYDDMEESRHYHEGFKEGLDECYGQMPIQGYIGEATSYAADADEVLTRWVSSLNPMSSHRIDKELQILGANDSRTGGPELYNAIKQAVMTNPKWKNSEIGKYVRQKTLDEASEVADMASYGAHTPTMEDDMYEVDKTSYMKQQAIKTPGDTFNAFGQTFKDKEVVESPFAFEALEQQLNALLESKADVAEGMTVSISKGQQGAPDSVSVSAQDGEADQLLDIIKSAGLGLFGGDNTSGYGAPQGGQPQHGGLDVVGDHDGMMALIKKVSGGEAGNGDYADEEGHADEHGHEGACESCGGMMEAGHSCDEGQQMVDEVQSEDQMTYEMAEDNPPDSGADNTNAAIADTAQANQAAAEYNPSNDVDEGAGGPEASEEPVEKLTPDPKYAHESPPQESDQEPDDQESDSVPDDDPEEEQKEKMSESMFVNLYKKLTLISEESTSEKDDKAEKAAKKVAKDIEYDEDHKGKDDDKAEEAGKKVKKDIEYDDKKDKKKIDEWANDAGPGKSASDTAFETDIDFMMNVISGGLNKRKQTGQTTIPIIAGQNRTTSHKTTDINESVEYSNDAVAQWKKLAGLK